MQSRVHSHHNEIHPCKVGAGYKDKSGSRHRLEDYGVTRAEEDREEAKPLHESVGENLIGRQQRELGELTTPNERVRTCGQPRLAANRSRPKLISINPYPGPCTLLLVANNHIPHATMTAAYRVKLGRGPTRRKRRTPKIGFKALAYRCQQADSGPLRCALRRPP